jgi:hypothetical protein
MKKTGIEILQKFHKKPLDNLSLYVIYCIAFFTVYSIAEFIVSSITGVSHDTLTEAVKFFCGGEAFLCCLLKLLKVRKTT